MTAALVEGMAPEDLWELFQRVVPPAPERPQSGGRRREVTVRCWPRSSSWPPQAVPGTNCRRASGCRESPPFDGSPSGPRPAAPEGECGPSSTAWWSWTNSAPGATWTGHDARSTRSASAQRGPPTGPNPTDRSKNGSKIHLIADRQGLPLSVGISAANLRGSQASSRWSAASRPSAPVAAAGTDGPADSRGQRLRLPAPAALAVVPRVSNTASLARASNPADDGAGIAGS